MKNKDDNMAKHKTSWIEFLEQIFYCSKAYLTRTIIKLPRNEIDFIPLIVQKVN